MTREVIGSVCVAVWLGCIAATAGQLPPEIQVDRYLLRADRLMEAKDPKGALEVMGKIVALQKEHTLPDHFKHAKVAFSAGEVQEAVDAVHTYLLEEKASSTGRRWSCWTRRNSGNSFSLGSAPIKLARPAERHRMLDGVDGACYVWNGSSGDLDGHVFRRAGPRGGNAQVGLGRWRENFGIYGKPHRRQGTTARGSSRSGRRRLGRPLCGRQEARPVGLRASGGVQEGPSARGTASGSFAMRTETSWKAPMWTARSRPVGLSHGGRRCPGRPVCGGEEARPVGLVGGRRCPGRPLCGRQEARPVGLALGGRKSRVCDL